MASFCGLAVAYLFWVVYCAYAPPPPAFLFRLPRSLYRFGCRDSLYRGSVPIPVPFPLSLHLAGTPLSHRSRAYADACTACPTPSTHLRSPRSPLYKLLLFSGLLYEFLSVYVCACVPVRMDESQRYSKNKATTEETHRHRGESEGDVRARSCACTYAPLPRWRH